MQKHITKRVLATLSVVTLATLLVQAYVFAQPSSNPPGGNIDATFDSVGVGNSSPTERLVVGEDLGDVNTSESIVVGVTNPSTGAPGITLGESANDNARINWSNSLNALMMYTKNAGVSNGSQLVLANSGNIGIGTSNPNEELVIGTDLGEIWPESTGLVLGNGSYASHVTLGESATDNGHLWWSPNLGGLSLTTTGGGVHNNYQLFLDDNGNIGMDTFSPFAKLQLGDATQYIDTAFVTDHPTTFAIADETTDSTPSIWLGQNGYFNGSITFNSNTKSLELMAQDGVYDNTQQLVLSGNGNVGINAGSTITGKALLVKPTAYTSVTEVVRGEYDTSNYGSLGTSNAGLVGVGEKYGAKTSVTSDGNGSNTYGIYSTVNPGGGSSGALYYSGYFANAGGTPLLGEYRGLYADARTGASIDIAEYILDTNDNLEAADVVIADPNNAESVIKSSTPYDTNTLGIISTKPHLTMGADIIRNPETGEEYEDVNAAKLTLAGRVPVKVTNENGQIKPGDLLTTSSTPGYAMKWTPLDETQAKDFEELKAIMAENTRRQNAIIGKALAPLDGEEGKIVALLSL